MKKTKFERRVENSINAFFDESLSSENNLTLFAETSFLDNKSSVSATDKLDAVVKMLKQVFVFFPSAFYLFFGTMAFFMFNYVTSNRLSILFWLFVSAAAMVFAIGDLRKPKHFLMPASVAGLAMLAFLLFSMTGISTHIWAQKYVIYFLPLALITPFLVKGLIDKNS